MKIRLCSSLTILAFSSLAMAAPPSIEPIEVLVKNQSHDPVPVAPAANPFQLDRSAFGEDLGTVKFPPQSKDVIIKDVSMGSRITADSAFFEDFLAALENVEERFLSCSIRIVDENGFLVYERLLETLAIKTFDNATSASLLVQAASNVHVYVPAGRFPQLTCNFGTSNLYDYAAAGGISGYYVN